MIWKRFPHRRPFVGPTVDSPQKKVNNTEFSVFFLLLVEQTVEQTVQGKFATAPMNGMNANNTNKDV